MTINNWPESERPREKLLINGVNSLSDAELLALFIGSGIQGQTAVDISRDLLIKYQGLRPVLDADLSDLTDNPGLGKASYALFQAALELGRRYLHCEIQRLDTLTDPHSTSEYLRAQLRAYPYEVFACIFLDNRHRIICFEELFRGTIDGASVYPREVVRRGLYHNAAAVILAHNHPSGVAEPSHADQSITRKLSDALALVDIRVLDHIIVGDQQTLSFAERGLIS
jgi:DNA repair protein RadC